MGRTVSVPGGRPLQVLVRLSVAEKAELDRQRGSLDPGAYVRWLLLVERKAGRTVTDPRN